MDEETWQLTLKRLKHQLQALAVPAKVQLGLLPDFVCKADELALDFGHWCLCLLSNDNGRLTASQRAALVEIDNLFDKMTAKNEPALWTDDALGSRPEWEIIRQKAKRALALFAWPVDKPAEPI